MGWEVRGNLEIGKKLYYKNKIKRSLNMVKSPNKTHDLNIENGGTFNVDMTPPGQSVPPA